MPDQPRTITLILDEPDWNTIQDEIGKRQGNALDMATMPDGDSTLVGAILAECIRDLDEYRSLWESHHA